MVFAAVAPEPFDFSHFTRNGHWDYRALTAADSGLAGEAGMLAVVDQMTTQPYQYDLSSYRVHREARWRYAGWYAPWDWGYYRPGYWPYRDGLWLGWGFGFGPGWHRDFDRR
jgi:hypothetical protein